MTKLRLAEEAGVLADVEPRLGEHGLSLHATRALRAGEASHPAPPQHPPSHAPGTSHPRTAATPAPRVPAAAAAAGAQGAALSLPGLHVRP